MVRETLESRSNCRTQSGRSGCCPAGTCNLGAGTAKAAVAPARESTRRREMDGAVRRQVFLLHRQRLQSSRKPGVFILQNHLRVRNHLAGCCAMLKEKYFVFIFLLGVGLNVLVLACLILMGQRADARSMWHEFRHGLPTEG